MAKYFIYCGIFYTNIYTNKFMYLESFTIADNPTYTAISLRSKFQANAKMYIWLGTKQEAEKIEKYMKGDRKKSESIYRIWKDGVELWKIMKPEIEADIEKRGNVEKMLFGE